MREYLVTFHKIVSDDTGHDHRVLQRQAVVTARSDVAAAFAAKAMLCEACGVIDWRMRADTCEVAELTRQAA
ncbi:Neuroendocrine-specific golgi family protein P55 (NESP55) [Methylorubrum thiocyanatum]